MRKIYVALMVAVTVGLIAVYHAHATSTEISACYSTTNGALRIVTSGVACRTGEVPLTWNVQGPPGPQGEKGDSGVSKVYSTGSYFGTQLSTWSNITPNNTIVASLDLPAGKYFASSKVVVSSSGRIDVMCVMAAGDFGGQYIDTANSLVTATTFGATTVSLGGAFELTSPQKVAVWCGGDGTWGHSALSAIQVDEINFQNLNQP